MSEVHDLLGINGPSKAPSSLSLDTLNGPKIISKHFKKPKGMARETFDLLSVQQKLELVQGGSISDGKAVTPKFKTKIASAFKGKWAWSDIPSSARGDDPTPFYHWIKADFHYTDYPYAKFNQKLDQIQYTDEEYNSLLVRSEWSREDTNTLFSICYQFDLRWPIIVDRAKLSRERTLDAMQARFYSALAAIEQHRATVDSSSSSSSSSSSDGVAPIDETVPEDIAEGELDRERLRRMKQDVLFKLNKACEKTGDIYPI